MTVENKKGRFGKFGGQYVPEIVMPVLNQLEEAYEKYRRDPDFLADLRKYYVEYAGRPTLCIMQISSPSTMAEPKSISSGRICSTLAPTRLTMLWDRLFWHSVWARSR